MKLLVLRFSAIGDIILTSVATRCLKNKSPQAEIHYATKPVYVPLLRSNPHITKVHLLDSSLLSLAGSLRAEKFDYIIDLHNNQRTFLIKLLLGVKSSSLKKFNLEKILLTKFKIDRFPDTHVAERMLEACRPLEVEDDGLGLEYFIPAEDEVAISSLPSAFQKGYIAWGIGGSTNTKKFPVSKIAEVIRTIDWPVIFLGDENDAKEAETIRLTFPDKNILNACGKYNINQSASLVRQADFVASNDTSVMHMAAAFKKPVISFWGNTTPRFGMGPYYGKVNTPHFILEVKGLPCRPCSRLGYAQCPKGHFNCMNGIKIPEVVSAIDTLKK